MIVRVFYQNMALIDLMTHEKFIDYGWVMSGISAIDPYAIDSKINEYGQYYIGNKEDA